MMFTQKTISLSKFLKYQDIEPPIIKILYGWSGRHRHFVHHVLLFFFVCNIIKINCFVIDKKLQF